MSVCRETARIFYKRERLPHTERTFILAPLPGLCNPNN
jgi:hypothetical protein